MLERNLAQYAFLLRDLYALGYSQTFCDDPGIVGLIRRESDETMYAKLQWSNVESTPSRHWYGVAYRDFAAATHYVFGAQNETRLLIVPTDVLQDFYEAHRPRLKTVKQQWHVNIHFDRSGSSFLKAVGLPTVPLMLSAYGHAIPAVAGPTEG